MPVNCWKLIDRNRVFDKFNNEYNRATLKTDEFVFLGRQKGLAFYIKYQSNLIEI